MRLLLILIILLLTGCIQNKMTAGEIAVCIESTHVSVTTIPHCLSSTACEKEWDAKIKLGTFSKTLVGGTIYQARNGIEKTWESLNKAAETLEKVKQSCEKGSFLTISSEGSIATGQIYAALKSSEEAHVQAINSAVSAVTSGSKRELIWVKDSMAFNAYAELLALTQSLAGEEETNPIAEKVKENQAYYEKIGTVLSEKEIPHYAIALDDAYKWYDTGIKVFYPDKKQPILWFSTIWKTGIQSIISSTNWEKQLATIQQIQGDEVIQSITRVVSPDKGSAIEIIRLIDTLDKGIIELENEENNKMNDLTARLEKSKEKLEKNKMMQQEQEAGKLLATYYNTNPPIMEKNEKKEYNKIILEIEETIEKVKNEKKQNPLPIGKRVATLRETERKITEIESFMKEEEQNAAEWGAWCKKKSNEEKITIITEYACTALLEEHNFMEENKDGALAQTRLITCVNELNNAYLAIEEKGTEWKKEDFIYQFGEEAAEYGCKSQLQNIANEYENNSLTQELHELAKKTARESVALQAALEKKLVAQGKKEILTKAEKTLAKVEKWLPLSKQIAVIIELEEVSSSMQIELYQIINENTQKGNWIFSQPNKIVENGEGEEEVSFFVENPIGKEVVLDNPIQLKNPFTQFVFTNESENKIKKGEPIIISNGVIPIQGKWVNGKASFQWGQSQITKEIGMIWGNVAEQIIKIEMNNPAQNGIIEWKTELPDSINEKTINASHEGKSSSVEKIDKIAKGTIYVNEAIEKIIVSFQQENIFHTTTQESSIQNGEKKLTQYVVTIQSHLQQEAVGDVTTGILLNWIGGETAAFDEKGKKIGYVVGPLGEIILSKIAFSPMGIREITIIKTEEANTATNVKEILLEKIIDATKSNNIEFAAEAAKLASVIKNETDIEKFPAHAQKLSALLDKIEKEKNTANQTYANWDAVMEKINENNVWNEQIEILAQKGKMEKENEKWKELQQTTATLEKIVNEEIEKNTTQDKEPTKIAIENILQKIGKIEEWIAKYKIGINIGCAKLGEIGYYCPITEEGLRDITNKTKKDRKVAENLQKKAILENKDTEETALLSERVQNNLENISNGFSAIKETAAMLLEEITKNANLSNNEEVKSAKEKAENFFENEEYGKSIFVSKNLVNYLAENKMIGLENFPAEGWPLIGLIIGIGGFIAYRYRKKPVEEKKQQKPLPRAHTTTQPNFPSSEPIYSGVSRPLRKQMEDRSAVKEEA
ncbi:MAG: hypothetical protein V1776_00160 [Candidatus Diapherotrites archaeon]